MAEEKATTPKTKFYRIKEQATVEQKGQVLNRTPRFAGVENGGVGDVLQLTDERRKALGEDYFEELNDKQHKEWVESGYRKQFLGLDNIKK